MRALTAHLATVLGALLAHPVRLITVVVIVLAAPAAWAQTTVSGTVSGTWARTQSPYIVIDDVTVPAGSVLMIEPGVEVILGENVSINVNGQLLAVGEPETRISFKALNSSVHWNRIYVQYSGATSKFAYCDISDAQVGIEMKIGWRSGATMQTEIRHCTFRNIPGSAIRGEAQGDSYYGWSGCWGNSPHINPIISGNIFTGVGDGCTFYTHGDTQHCGGPGGRAYSYGHASPVIANNIFADLSGAAFNMTAGNYAGPSQPVFRNNTVIRSSRGVLARSPYDAVVQNNIFVEDSVAVEREDTLTEEVTYNLFHRSVSDDFVGYPPAYGSVVMQNRNGDPTDIAFNLFQDPRFESETSLRLSPQSPAIDAGDADTPLDPDLTIADLGAHYFDQSASLPVAEPAALDFGEILAGDTASDTVTLTNVLDELAVGSFSGSTPDNFQIVSTLQEPGRTRLVLSFAPDTARAYEAKLEVEGGGGGIYIPVSGVGIISPLLTYAPATLDFGEVHLGDSLDREVALANVGNADLAVQSIALEGTDADAFRLLTPGGSAVLEPEEALSAIVRFQPDRVGELVAHLVVTSDAASSPDSVLLRAGVVGVDVEHSTLPTTFTLEQSYPNPFNSTAKIRYALPSAQDVTLTIYDLQGREVARLVDQRQAPGRFEVALKARKLPSGVYFYRLRAGETFSDTKKFVLMK